MNNLTRTILVAVLTVLCCAVSMPVSAQSDDDDSYYAPQKTSDESNANNQQQNSTPQNSSLRFGVMEVRATFEAQQAVSKQVLRQVTAYLKQATEEINVAPKVVIPHSTVFRFLNPQERQMYSECWIEVDCLNLSLKQANLDVVTVAKLRMKTIDTTTMTDSEGNVIYKGESHTSVLTEGGEFLEKSDNYAEYTLFIRLIDLKGRKTLKEILVYSLDFRKIPEIGQKAYRKALVELGLITNRPPGMASMDVTDNKEESIVEEEMPPPIDFNRTYKIAAYSTLAAGVALGGVGLLMGSLSNTAQSDAKTATTVSDMNSANDRSKAYMITANTMYGVGGALLISSAVLFVLGFRDSGDFMDGSGGGDPASIPGSLSITPDGFFLQAKTSF